MKSAVSRVPSSAPVAFEDGFGQRRVAVRSDGGALELLTFRESLTAAPSFEFALRDRVSRLADFQSERFARVHGVEKVGPDGSRLALVSDHVAGFRLSDLLAAAESRLLPIETHAALSIIRQLAHAVAALHDHAPDLCHGAVGPERIVLTPGGRLVLVEHVLGGAIDQLRYANAQYWRELRVPLPRSIGAPIFDRRADVTQIGATALALLVGRPLADDDYPDRVADMTSGAWAIAPGGGIEPLPLPLRVWLQRALQIDSRTPFGSAPEARAELDRVLHYSDPIAEQEGLKVFLARYQGPDAGQAPTATPPPAPAPRASQARPAPAMPVPMTSSTRTAAAQAPASGPVASAPATTTVPGMPVAPPAPQASAPTPEPIASMDPNDPIAGTRLDAPAPDATESAVPPRAFEHTLRQAVPVLRALPTWRLVAAAVVLVVLTSGGVMAARQFLGASPAVDAGTLVVQSNPTGATVAIDDEERGVTPLSLELAPGRYTLKLITQGNVRSMPITMTAGAQLSQYIELPRVSSVLGQLRVQTDPGGARVSVDGHSYGPSPVTVEGLAPGAHTVVLESDQGRVTQEVRIEAGETASLMVPLMVRARPAAATAPASGWVTVAAPGELQVYANGERLGSSRTGRIRVPAGRHELRLVSEELGYAETLTVDVTAGRVTPVDVPWPSGALAINAAPWAEVWIDGERAGETPLGNVELPIGGHDVMFRHPELGERQVRAVVRAADVTKVTVDLRTR